MRMLIGCVTLTLALPSPAAASDHGDAPALIEGVTRREADLTDVYAFTQGDDIVLIIGFNAGLPRGTTSYLYPSDVRLRLHVDNDSPVAFGGTPERDADLVTYGGTILDPKHVAEDITFSLSFDDNGDSSLRIQGLPKEAEDLVHWEDGTYDDPFIGANQNAQLRNVGALVLQMPLALVTGGRSNATLLVWGDSSYDDWDGPRVDHMGRASWMAVTTTNVNRWHPRHHFRETGKPPAVIIYDVSKPAGFPNGRRLADDVRHIIRGEPSATNRRCFEQPTVFPYLAPPNTATCTALP